jgi:hypothetical protein
VTSWVTSGAKSQIHRGLDVTGASTRKAEVQAPQSYTLPGDVTSMVAAAYAA